MKGFVAIEIEFGVSGLEVLACCFGRSKQLVCFLKFTMTSKDVSENVHQARLHSRLIRQLLVHPGNRSIQKLHGIHGIQVADGKISADLIIAKLNAHDIRGSEDFFQESGHLHRQFGFGLGPDRRSFS